MQKNAKECLFLMKTKLPRNIVLMLVLTVVMAVMLARYINSTGNVPAADRAESCAVDSTSQAAQQ